MSCAFFGEESRVHNNEDEQPKKVVMKDYTTGTSVCAYLSIAHIFFDKYAISLPAGKKGLSWLLEQDAQQAKNGKIVRYKLLNIYPTFS